MCEVYASTKTGRPTVLLLLAAGSLMGALGLAWVQVRGGRALGDAVQIEGTPLAVRPPAGWVPGRDRRGVFVKTIEVAHEGQQREAIERSIKFEYRRWRVFQPLPDLLRRANMLDEKQAYEPEPAQIGGFNGVQVRRARVFRWRGRQERGETIYRLVSTARGDQISVEYMPLGEVAPGDMELFDAVCEAVTLTDPGVNTKPEEVLAHAGLRFPVPENWTTLGSDYPEVPGLYVQHNDDNGIPAWGLGVFRTWLARGRGPAELLTSFSELNGSEAMRQAELQAWTRSDGAAMATLQQGATNSLGGDVASAWVIAKSPVEVVLIFALAGSRAAPAANEAAARLAEEIEFLTSYPPDGIAAVEANGRELAALLRQNGPAPWWGESEVAAYYYGEISGEPLLVISGREAIDGDPARGYKGRCRYLWRDPTGDSEQSWVVDASAGAYAGREENDFDRTGRAQTVIGDESREVGESSIRRPSPPGSRSGALSIPVGPTFVCPPVDTLAHVWVAQQADGAWLIEVSSLRGTTTQTQLLVPLEPNADGQHRVLLVDDYWPRGTIVTFGSDLEITQQESPAARFERIDREQAQEIQRALGRG